VFFLLLKIIIKDIIHDDMNIIKYNIEKIISLFLDKV